MDASALSEIPGGPELIAWFGHAPTFHDAEILELFLNRDGESTLRIHAWRMTDQVNEKNEFISDKHAIVTFKLHGISALQLDGFSSQNVIFGLQLRRLGSATAPAHADEPGGYELTLEPCYGLHGVICAARLSVTVASGE